MHGILLVDKPAGITSNQVVGIVKKRVRPSKVGHTGTLDPAATGLVVVLIGAGTRTLDYLDERRKRYSLEVMLGEETDTCDREGTVTRTEDPSAVTESRISEVLGDYLGVLDQVPPHFAAIKKNGVPLYKLARKGVFPELEPRKIEIFSLEMNNWAPPILELEMVCSKGTYARALARDIGRDLAVGGRLESLRRTMSGSFSIENAVTTDEIAAGGADMIAENLIPLTDALAHVPSLEAVPAEIRRLMRGNPIAVASSRMTVQKALSEQRPRLFKIVSGDGGLIVLARPQPKGAEFVLRPVRVFKAWED
jgi:tRNA pseudouridine55 synthase